MPWTEAECQVLDLIQKKVKENTRRMESKKKKLSPKAQSVVTAIDRIFSCPRQARDIQRRDIVKLFSAVIGEYLDVDLMKICPLVCIKMTKVYSYYYIIEEIRSGGDVTLLPIDGVKHDYVIKDSEILQNEVTYASNQEIDDFFRRLMKTPHTEFLVQAIGIATSSLDPEITPPKEKL